MGIFMVVHLIDFHRIAVYEAGAALISVLAYPGDGDEELRAGVHASLCHHALRVLCAIEEPDWALSPQLMKPLYALRTPDEVRKDLRTLQRRLRDRMAAGRMAIGFLKKAVGGMTELAGGPSRVSINQLVRLVLDDTGQIDPENVETRIWRQSLPAIHIASTIQVYLQLAEPEMGKLGLKLGLETFLLNRGAIEWVVREAELCASIIEQSPHLPIDPTRLIRVRLADIH